MSHYSFHHSEGKTPSHRSYRSPGICISIGPRPPRCALLVFLGMCRKGLGASCCLGCCLRHYSNGAGAELGQDLGRLCSECALPEPQGSPGLCSMLRSWSIHEHLHDFVFQSHPYILQYQNWCYTAWSAVFPKRDTQRHWNISQIPSTVNRKGIESIRDTQKKVLQALMGHDKTMGITWIKV